MTPPDALSALAARGPYPPGVAEELAAGRPEAVRAAVMREIDAGRREGLAELLEALCGIGEYAAWARAQRARLHRAAGEFAAALALYDELLRSFAPRATPHWAVGRARCLIGLDRFAEAEAQGREAVSAFPQSPEPHAFLAWLLTRRGRDGEALAAWRDLHRRVEAPDLDAHLGLHGALKACGLDDEAAGVAAGIVARWPEPRALRELATTAMEYGEAARARDGLMALGERAGAADLAMLARAQHETGDLDAGAATLAELERRFPDSSLAESERLWLAREREAGLDEWRERVEAALRRFPADPGLRGSHVLILVALGRLDEAEAETAALEREESAAAFGARLKVEAFRGDPALYAWLAGRERLSAGEACQAAQALLDLRTREAFARGEALVARARESRPDHARLRYFAARFAIALGKDEAALALIEGFPRGLARREILELRAWEQAKRGRDGDAKALWRRATEGHFYPALHASPGRLTRIGRDLAPPEAGVTAFVAFRNEAAHIADFLAHHRRLGVRRFVLFDHASDDGGRERALAEPDVVVYDCPDSFQLSACGRRWMREIVAREGASGWGLQVDMDERLIFPGCETAGLDRLIGYLDARGFEAVRGFMLDLYPRRLADEAGTAPDFAAHRFWDDSYFSFGVPRPPYFALGGGIRARLFEAKEYLYKVPLWRLDAGDLLSPHETTHMRFADVSAALLHYKLMNLALRGGARAKAGTALLEADADVEAIRSHSRYAARLAALGRDDLFVDGLTRELEDSWGLTRAGLMQASAGWRDASG